MIENRRHFRFREFIDVVWKLEDQDVSGEGTVVNISASGLFLQTDRVFTPSDNCVLSIDSQEAGVPFADKKGALMWFRRIQTPQERFQCGIEFLNDKLDIDFQQWLLAKVNRLSEAENVSILGKNLF